MARSAGCPVGCGPAPGRRLYSADADPVPDPKRRRRPAYDDPMSQQNLPRTGIGVDVHAFAGAVGRDAADSAAQAGTGDAADADVATGAAAPRSMWLACLEWPGVPGLVGHSDGDVAAHAVVDAVLSAAGLGDIGSVYGTADPRWKGAAGAEFLADTGRRAREAGYAIGNVVVQVIGVQPRVGPRRAEAQAAMTEALGAPVALSATTTDRLGFTGRGEGVAAIATALVVPAP